MLKREFGYWEGLLHKGYPDTFKSIRICIEAIRILEDSIRIRWNENLAAEAEGIRMHEESIRMRMDAIRILQESIRMPAIQNHEHQRTNAKSSKQML